MRCHCCFSSSAIMSHNCCLPCASFRPILLIKYLHENKPWWKQPITKKNLCTACKIGHGFCHDKWLAHRKGTFDACLHLAPIPWGDIHRCLFFFPPEKPNESKWSFGGYVSLLISWKAVSQTTHILYHPPISACRPACCKRTNWQGSQIYPPWCCNADVRGSMRL